MNRRNLIGVAAFACIGVATEEGLAANAVALPPGAKLPAFRLIYECGVTIAPALDFGMALEGHRRVIPITGGTFQGPQMRGEVLSIGADWNLSRSDGASSVDAAYYLRTDDQVLIRIVNRGVGGPVAASDTNSQERFLMYTYPEFEAPAGKYEWLNRGMFIGTLSVKRGTTGQVLIRTFELI